MRFQGCATAEKGYGRRLRLFLARQIVQDVVESVLHGLPALPELRHLGNHVVTIILPLTMPVIVAAFLAAFFGRSVAMTVVVVFRRIHRRLLILGLNLGRWTCKPIGSVLREDHASL